MKRLFVVNVCAGHFSRVKSLENVPKRFRKAQKQHSALRQALVEACDKLLAGFQLEVDGHILAENDVDARGIAREWIQQVECLKAHQGAHCITGKVAIAVRL